MRWLGDICPAKRENGAKNARDREEFEAHVWVSLRVRESIRGPNGILGGSQLKCPGKDMRVRERSRSYMSIMLVWRVVRQQNQKAGHIVVLIRA